MKWLDWIKSNKKLMIPIIVVIIGGIAMIFDVISLEDFMNIFREVQEVAPIEGGG